MRPTSYLALGLVCLTGLADAFPSPDNLGKLAQQEGLELDELVEGLVALKQKRVLNNPSIPIEVTGAHAFIPPNFQQGDQRGPCPGLNALANHGYISRDGVPSFLEVIDGINSVYGMGLDLATTIAAMGLVGTGNPLSLTPGFSIGGKSPKSSNLLGNLLGLLGTPRGLEGSHNFIEADSSNTRDDLYVTGDAATMNMDLFMSLYNSIGPKGYLSMEDVGDRASARLKESIATNPLFWYGPYTGLIVRNAGFAFGARLLSNHTAEFPRGGRMDKTSLKSFWAVTERADGSLKYNKGWERIPNNWYRLRGDYTFVDLNLDFLAWVAKHPELANMGGNLGAVNSFAGVDLSNLTGGVLNSATLLQGNNLVCFSLEIVKAFAPNSLSSLFTTLAKPIQVINDAFLDPILNLGCPAMKELEAGGKDLLGGLLQKYPGAKKAGFAF